MQEREEIREGGEGRAQGNFPHVKCANKIIELCFSSGVFSIPALLFRHFIVLETTVCTEIVCSYKLCVYVISLTLALSENASNRKLLRS
jgi:hypothetical protein